MNPADWLTGYAVNQAAEWRAEADRLMNDYEYAQQQVAYWESEAKNNAA